MEIYIQLPKDIQSMIEPSIYQHLHEINFSNVLNKIDYNYDHKWEREYYCYYCKGTDNLYETYDDYNQCCQLCDLIHDEIDDITDCKLNDSRKLERYQTALLKHTWFKRLVFLATTKKNKININQNTEGNTYRILCIYRGLISINVI